MATSQSHQENLGSAAENDFHLTEFSIGDLIIPLYSNPSGLQAGDDLTVAEYYEQAKLDLAKGKSLPAYLVRM